MPCYSIDGLMPVVNPSAHVHPAAVLIGDVWVGPGVYVGPCASLRGDNEHSASSSAARKRFIA